MKVGIANDHHGIEINKNLTKYLESLGYNVVNYGPGTTEPVDYPVYAFKLGEAVANRDVDFGIVICNSGIGVSIACNKVKGVRCANDANVIAVGSRLPIEELQKIIKTFLETDFSHVERHQRRIDLINNYNG